MERPSQTKPTYYENTLLFWSSIQIWNYKPSFGTSDSGL
ncbi:MAG: hypothetical protein JWP45_2002 [Mucilaginibacter sp.]|nr:hypothetical protein [Mucilaginibacter sp.]